MKIEHSPGAWHFSRSALFATLRDVASDTFVCSWDIRGVESKLPSEDDGNLLALAKTAPHECSDPECPGNVNRLKLEAHDDLLEACNMTDWALTGLAEHEPESDVGKVLWAQMRDAQRLSRAAIAKAPELRRSINWQKLDAASKMADFITTWRDALAGVVMGTADFVADSGLVEYEAAIAKGDKAEGGAG